MSDRAAQFGHAPAQHRGRFLLGIDDLELAGQDLKKDVGMMTSPDVAHLSIEAMLRGDVVYVPGVLNKVSTLVRFLPRALKLRIVEKSMRMAVQPK